MANSKSISKTTYYFHHPLLFSHPHKPSSALQYCTAVARCVLLFWSYLDYFCHHNLHNFTPYCNTNMKAIEVVLMEITCRKCQSKIMRHKVSCDVSTQHITVTLPPIYSSQQLSILRFLTNPPQSRTLSYKDPSAFAPLPPRRLAVVFFNICSKINKCHKQLIKTNL